MPRAASLLVLLAACDDVAWDRLGVDVDYEAGVVAVSVSGNVEEPCPVLAGELTVNGVVGDVVSDGGPTREPIDETEDCDFARVVFEDLPVDTGTLEVRVDGDPDQPAIRARVDWPTEVAAWSDDDLAAAYLAGDTFTIQWTPLDLEVTALGVREAGLQSSATVEQVSAATDSAVYRFVGTIADPATLSVDIAATLRRDPVICEGVPTCSFQSSEGYPLGPRAASPSSATSP